MSNMEHMNYIDAVRQSDVDTLRKKEATYQGSWKAAGGRSAWFMARRNMDRLITMLAAPKEPVAFNLANVDDTIEALGRARVIPTMPDGVGVPLPGTGTATAEIVKYLRDSYVSEDIFRAIEADPGGEDGTVLACVRDLRCYFTLIEAEMMARGVVQQSGEAAAAHAAAHFARDHMIVLTDRQVSNIAHGRDKDDNGRDTASDIIAEDKAWHNMTEAELHSERARLVEANNVAKGWGAAVGVRGEFITEIDQELARRGQPLKPMVMFPTPDTKLRTSEYVPSRTPEDGGHHASVTPYVVRSANASKFFDLNCVSSMLRDLFWRVVGIGVHRVYVLETHVTSIPLPRVLQGCYHVCGTNEWVIDINRVPPDARSYFPSLQRELNMKDLDDKPDWQRKLYRWNEDGNKFVLFNDAWHVEAE